MMKIKGIGRNATGVTALLLLLAWTAAPASAQYKDVYVSTDGTRGVLKLKAPDGTIVALDNGTNTAYISSANGRTFEISFEDAVNHATSSSRAASSMLSRLRASLTDPAATATLTTSIEPRLAIVRRPPPDDGGIDYDPQISSSDLFFHSAGLGGPCDLPPAHRTDMEMVVFSICRTPIRAPLGLEQYRNRPIGLTIRKGGGATGLHNAKPPRKAI